jgi:transcriptional regulator with XRE-family HTH domain
MRNVSPKDLVGICINTGSAEQLGFSRPAAHPHAFVFYNESMQQVLRHKWEIKKMPKKPYADTRLARFIDKRVLELRPKKSQIEIAIDSGFVSVNMLSMLKKGSSKLPIDRVPSLARALEVDPAYLLRLTLEQAKGDTIAQALVEIMGTPVTGNELGWLQEIRSASDHTDPRMTGRNRAAIRSIFGK